MLMHMVNDIASTSNVLDFILITDDTTILYSHEKNESQISIVSAEIKRSKQLVQSK